ncbi:HAD-IA family hydrolase [Levilactobacillus acidifarinae]|uniref:HAD family sugar phosphatase n=1 Tax=Levilactobacillus acidifarinae DSM 19394 = JCM 15949 TaxID=1423715 RepID=A0A0R1LRR6_9LACO|nr:HAD-IA family hydrolase [Levilactobacillus acidifarinae]KRK94055.1 HAD family sugar phosphatase [Levilactobacillus acidifarinae DSM 19394]GEO69779.1 beta-phosphoglucomutase [Levilactobacillus acidifarinae]
MTTIHGFLFDLHGVIADSWQYHLKSWQTVARELDIPWTSTLATRLPGMSRADSLTTILASVGRAKTLTAAQFQAMTDHENDLYRQYVTAMTPANRLPGVTAFLTELQQAGYPLALASASTNAAAEIDRLGLSAVFDKIVPAANLGASKPAPDVYLAAAELLDLAPGACVAFEDTVTGVQAATAAGCVTIGINAVPLTPVAAMLPGTHALSLATVRRVLAPQAVLAEKL